MLGLLVDVFATQFLQNVDGLDLWNSLPAELRLLDISLQVFRKRLKMFLF